MSLLSKAGLAHLLGEYGYGLVFVLIGLEAMGLPLPGESLIIAAAVYCATTGKLHIAGVVAAAQACTALILLNCTAVNGQQWTCAATPQAGYRHF